MFRVRLVGSSVNRNAFCGRNWWRKAEERGAEEVFRKKAEQDVEIKRQIAANVLYIWRIPSWSEGTVGKQTFSTAHLDDHHIMDLRQLAEKVPLGGRYDEATM